jgi:hypothetical protein
MGVTALRQLPIRIAFLASLLVVGALVVHEVLRDLHFDDAYMFVRYAGNLLTTGNYGWNAGERTYGCTSVAYTMFIALMRLIGFDALGPSRLLRVASLFWGVGAVVLLARVIRQAARGTILEDATARQGLLVAIIASPITFMNALTGMDTMLSLFATTAIVLCWFRFVDKPSTMRWLLAVSSCYFAFAARPDNAIYALLFPALFLWQARQPWSRILSTYGVLIALFGLDTFIKARYFGNPIPLPFYAKSRGFYEGYLGINRWNPMDYTWDFLLTYGGVLLMLNLLYGSARGALRAAAFLLPVVLMLAYYMTVIQIMGHNSRYYLPSVPFLVAGLIVALRDARTERVSGTRIAWAFLAVLAFASVRVLVAPRLTAMRLAREEAVAARFQPPAPDADEHGDAAWARITTMSAIAGRLPPGSTIGATEHGYIAAMNPRIRIMDLCGLHNPEMAMHGWSDDMLRRAAPEMIWMPHSDYTGLRAHMRSGAFFKNAYDLYPEALAYGVAIRRDSPHYAAIRTALERAHAIR